MADGGVRSLDERRPTRIEIGFDVPSVAVVTLVGEHDLGHHELQKEAFATAAARRRHMVVDLTRCEFIDSAAISRLLDAQRKVTAAGGSFLIVLPAEENAVNRTAELMQLSTMLRICPSTADALEALAAGDRRGAARP
jgi:anti-anti-sigma factor